MAGKNDPLHLFILPPFLPHQHTVRTVVPGICHPVCITQTFPTGRFLLSSILLTFVLPGKNSRCFSRVSGISAINLTGHFCSFAVSPNSSLCSVPATAVSHQHLYHTCDSVVLLKFWFCFGSHPISAQVTLHQESDFASFSNCFWPF